MSVDDESKGTEKRVFSTAKPAPEAESREEAVDESKKESTEPKHETEIRPRQRTKSTSGSPAWHLSLTLGLMIALVGGLALWLVSPKLAIIVVGSIILLAGLAFAVHKFFGRRTQADSTNRSTNREPGSARNSSSNSKNAPRGTSKNQRHDSATDAHAGKPRFRTNGTDRSDRSAKTRSKRGEDPRGSAPGRKPTAEKAPQTRAERRQQRREERREGRQPRDTTTGNTRRTRNDVSASDSSVTPTKRRRQSVQAEDHETALGGRHKGLDPRPRKRGWTEQPGGWDVDPTLVSKPLDRRKKDRKKQVAPSDLIDTSKTEKPSEKLKDRSRLKINLSDGVKLTSPAEKSSTSTTDTIAWPNVDLDQVKPVKAGHLPRVTAQRQPIKLPSQPRKTPEWPSEDPDVKIPEPRKPPPSRVKVGPRVKRGTVATPDLLTRAQREQHFVDAATIMHRSAQEKETQSYEFLSLAGQLEGMEGTERLREEHLQNAFLSAKDAETRSLMASWYARLTGRNDN